MGDVMLYGVLRMPFDMAMSGYLSQRQFYDRVQEAARRLEAAEARLAEIDEALASRPAEVDDEGLPALPEETMLGTSRHGTIFRGYTAEQFRQGQRDAVAADRARRLKPRNIDDGPVFNKLAYDFLDSGDMMSEVTDARYVALVEYINEWAAPSHTTNKEK